MDYQLNFKKKNSFTLIELIIVISIIAIFSGISLVAYNNFRFSNNLELASLEIVEALRYTQFNSRAVKEDSAWGIKIISNNIIIFKGDNYDNRDIGFDQEFSLSSRIELSGLDEIVFNKVTGFTNNAGLIVLNNNVAEKNIKINEKGTILY